MLNNMIREEYYGRDKSNSYKSVFWSTIGLITTILLLAILI